MEPIKLNSRCSSCPDGEMMVLGQFVYCTCCGPHPASEDPSRPAPAPC